jgi:PAS domain S-box-containing protein
MKDKGTILVVEDTPADLELLVDTFTAEGYEVLPAENGERALAAVAARPPDLVLLDIQMPGLDGFDVCRRLKALTESRDIPVVFITVYGERAERVAGLKLGAVDYITKPFEREELLARVRTHLEVGRLRVRLEQQATRLRLANERLHSELAERKQVELEMQRQAAFPRLNPNPVLELSAAGEINYLNGAAGEMARALGLESPAQMLPPNTAAIVRECLASDKPKLRVETPIGPRVISWSFFPVESSHSVHCYAGDITESRQAEEALRASQQVIEGILNAIPVRVFWKDKNLVYLGCNAVFARDAGFAEPKDIIGKDDYQMGWRDQAELYRGDDRQVIESGCSKLLIEEPQTTPAGNAITLLTSKLPLRGSKGEVSGVIGMYMDITERTQAEEVLRQRVKLQDQLVHIAATVPGMIYSLLMRPDGSTGMPYVSGALSDIFDLQPKDVIEDAAPVFSLIHPDDIGHVRATIAESARTLNRWRDDFRVCRTRLGEIWVEGHSVPQREPDGSTLWHGFVQNITERKQMEEKLRQLSRAVEQSPASIVITDPAGGIEYANRKFIEVTGYSLEEVLGKNSRILKSGDKSPEAYRELWQTIAAGKEWRGEFHNKKKNGEHYWESASISPIRDLAGRTTHYVAVKEDITARKHTEAERDQLIQDLRKALANVKSLSGLLPICAGCKKIRDDKGYWSQVESYVQKHSEATFTHGLCPDCIKKYYPELG